MIYKNKIRELLKKRGIESEEQIDAFLNPSISGLHNPFLLLNMEKAVNRINQAIKGNEKIVIYGDYDADGICSVSMLFLYLKSRNADVVGFIPNRHTDGYGISSQTVNYIKQNYNPQLVITVDTGISAKEEVDQLNGLNIDVIVTDHHEPPKDLPNAIIIDPKIVGQEYPFNGLSGAGVVFKLIQALSGVDEALKYVDLCAISTVGDIVPLLDENRIITTMGLEKINIKNARPSIAYLKHKLSVISLSSTDIAFKLVPRLNACGRISSASKCFEFLVSEDANELSELYKLIEADNNERLAQSSAVYEQIDQELQFYDFNTNPALFIVNKNINLGIIGIIASKLCASLNRPVFIFTEDEVGNLKASIRSIEGINIFNILDKYRDILVDVGGHSLAGGLTIKKENYQQFKDLILKELREVDQTLFLQTQDFSYDLEVQEKDINLSFAREIEKLEPFGFMNPKPVFLIKSSETKIVPMRSYKHYKVALDNKTEVVSFFGSKILPYFLSSSQKQLYVNIEVDTFMTKPRAKAILKNVRSEDYSFKYNQNIINAKHLYYLHHSQNETSLPKVLKDPKIKVNKFGQLFVTDYYKKAKQLAKDYGLEIVLSLPASGKSAILYNPLRTFCYQDLVLYKEVFFADGCVDKQEYACFKEKARVLDQITQSPTIVATRELYAKVYSALKKRLPAENNNFMELATSLSKLTELTEDEVVFGLLVGKELNLIREELLDGGIRYLNLKATGKKQLEDSYLYNLFK